MRCALWHTTAYWQCRSARRTIDELWRSSAWTRCRQARCASDNVEAEAVQWGERRVHVPTLGGQSSVFSQRLSPRVVLYISRITSSHRRCHAKHSLIHSFTHSLTHSIDRSIRPSLPSSVQPLPQQCLPRAWPLHSAASATGACHRVPAAFTLLVSTFDMTSAAASRFLRRVSPLPASTLNAASPFHSASRPVAPRLSRSSRTSLLSSIKRSTTPFAQQVRRSHDDAPTGPKVQSAPQPHTRSPQPANTSALSHLRQSLPASHLCAVRALCCVQSACDVC